MERKTALLVIDVQQDFFAGYNPLYKDNDLLAKVKGLIAKARAANTPVIYIQHSDEGLPLDSDNWQIHPEIAPLATDPVVHKHTADGFNETDLQEQLTRLGITDLTIAGLQTDFCVNATTRRAISLGYNVTLVEDAHSTYDTAELTAPDAIAQYNKDLAAEGAHLQSSEAVQFA